MAQVIDKLERLKQFTRLANSNPNDNEANLAARKACKLLEELNWQLPANTNSAQQRPPIDPFPGWGDIFGRTYNKYPDPDPYYGNSRAANSYQGQSREEAQRKADQQAEQRGRDRKAAEDYAKQEKAKKDSNEKKDKERREFDRFVNYEQRRAYNPGGDLRSDPKLWSSTKEYVQYMRERFLQWKAQNIGQTFKGQSWDDEPYIYEPTNEESEFFRHTKTGSKVRDLRCRKCGVINETAYVGPVGAYICYRCQFKGTGL